MQRTGWLCLGLALLAGAGLGRAEKPVALESQDAQVNYSIGYRIGEDLKRQSVPLEAEALLAGIRDAIDGGTPRLSTQKRNRVMEELRGRMVEAAQAKRREEAAKNLAAAKAFLEENRAKEGVKTRPSGLQYKVLKEGTGPIPAATDTVSVHYRGKLLDGTEFDSSYRRNQPATFKLQGVIRGWSEALALMAVGSKWELFIPPDLAYAERGAGNRIPPNSALVFEVELLEVKGK